MASREIQSVDNHRRAREIRRDLKRNAGIYRHRELGLVSIRGIERLKPQLSNGS